MWYDIILENFEVLICFNIILEYFEVFTFRDAVNVAAYMVMSAGES